jgi:hypothetical protein
MTESSNFYEKLAQYFQFIIFVLSIKVTVWNPNTRIYFKIIYAFSLKHDELIFERTPKKITKIIQIDHDNPQF